jgi:hypothetical protein
VRVRAVRVAVVLVLACGAVLAAAVPALAKGPIRAVVEGPALSPPIMLRGETAIQTFDEESGFWTVLACRPCDGRLDTRPTGPLGPRYTVTYTMIPQGDQPNRVVQYIYPDAVPRPLTYMAPGQRFWKQVTVGGWYVAGLALRQELIHISALPAAPASTSPASAPSAPALDERGLPMVTVLALALALVIGLLLVARVVFARLRPTAPKDQPAVGGSHVA